MSKEIKENLESVVKKSNIDSYVLVFTEEKGKERQIMVQADGVTHVGMLGLMEVGKNNILQTMGIKEK